jgi:hypothetical protein
MSDEILPLGFTVDVRAVEDSLRGVYDVTRLERDHPQMVSLIAWLLSLPGMTYQAVAQAAGISWESVAAISASRRESIREFKLRQAAKLGLVLDAAVGGLMAKAAAGKLSALDFKLLTDAWLQLSGEGQLTRVEAGADDPSRRALREFLAGGPPMVSEAGRISQSGAGAGALGCGAGDLVRVVAAGAGDLVRVDMTSDKRRSGDSDSPMNEA